MARVTGPLMSVDASGTYAKTLVYSKWKGRNYVRELVIPLNPKSAKQTGVRAMMSFLAQAWAAISAPDKATWAIKAAQKTISEFNAYVGENLARWQNFSGPTDADPAAEASTPLTISAHQYTGGVGQVSLSVTASGTTALRGIALFRSTAEITTTDWTQCIKILEVATAGPHVYVDTPLAAGTYHYRACTVQDDGVLGTVLADATAVVT